MGFKKEHQVRFQVEEKRNLEKTLEKNDEKQMPLYKNPAPLSKIEGGYKDKVPKFGRSKIYPEGQEQPEKKTILDPGSDTVLKWNRIFLFFCLVGLFMDPLFFYLPSVVNQGKSSCMQTDLHLGIVVTCFRTVADVFYLLHVVIKFRTAYVAPSSRVFGKGELVMDRNKIAKRYLKSQFFVDLIAALPLPQIVIWSILPAIRSSHADHTNNALVLIVLLQYIPRLYLIFPLSSQIIKATGVVTKTAWAGAAYNLLLYMLASHVLGASWYLLAIERHATCWKSACRHEYNNTRCSLQFFDCSTLGHGDRGMWVNSTLVFSKCDPDDTSYFNHGIFGNAVANDVVSAKFVEKYFYCLWWGLQNLSSYGQTLTTSTFIGETLFAILIAILGLVLFAHLIGNMQTYMQSITVRLEEWRLKRRDTEEWMRHRQLPDGLQQRVRRYMQYKWFTTRGVDEETILRALPMDLRRDIQRHLCLALVRRVPFFSQMDDQLLDAICERLVSSLSIQGTYIVREGDPVNEMLFIIRGALESSTTNGGRTGFFNSTTLKPGDFCGEELLAWALLPRSTLNLPSSTRTVKSLNEVEAFALRAEDLKFVANQFRRLHSKKLQHTFRYHSHHWRTWAACFIQAAWHRHKRRVMAKNLSMSESFNSLLRDEQLLLSHGEKDEEDGPGIESSASQTKQNLGVTILASRFAANTRRGAQKSKDVELPKFHAKSKIKQTERKVKMATLARISRRLLPRTLSTTLPNRSFSAEVAQSARKPSKPDPIISESPDRVKWDYRGQRKKIPLGQWAPKIAVDAYVAPNVLLAGQVVVYDGASVWNGAVLRGDLNKISVGFCSNVQEQCVIHAAWSSPTGLPAETLIDRFVTIGACSLLRSCTVEPECIIGQRSILMEGSLVETHSILEAGSVVPPGRRIPSGELWAGNPAKFVRTLTHEETLEIPKLAVAINDLSKSYFSEFLPYSTVYLEVEKLKSSLGISI